VRMADGPLDAYRNMTRPTLFFGLKLRHAVALLVCLAIVLILAGYFSVSAGKKAAFEAVTAQGRSLTETLISSAEMIIEADDEFVSLGLDEYLETVSRFSAPDKVFDQSSLDELMEETSADKVVFFSDGKIENSSSGRGSALRNEEIEIWVDSLNFEPDVEVVYEFRSIDSERYFWGYFPFDTTSGVFIAAPWTYGQYGNEKLSLYYLLNQAGREAGVEYIMLQNPDGIVFASKKIASMPKIADDPFLGAALTSDTTTSRLLNFQDREVLEIVKTFKSSEFEGLFRVGLSLYGYRQIADGMKRQVWLVVVALIIVGMLGFGAVIGFQNFDLLKAGLQKAHVMSRSLFDSIPGPVVAIDSDFRITDINAAARSTFGLQSLPESETKYHDVFKGDSFHFKQVLESKRSASFESAMGKAGHRYFVTATPLVGYDGAVLGAIAIAQDITDSRKLEEMAESRRRLSEMGALAASMAHEIRNPLNAIGITIQRMKSEIKPPEGEEDFHRFLDGLKMEIERLNLIIEKFLSVARSIKPRMEELDIGELLSSVYELFKNQAEAARITFTTDPGSGLRAFADRSALTQALVNVVKNSIEAVQSGGKIEISSRQSGDNMVISVADDGPGMEDVSLAMKPFHTTKEGGTGLGLATASKILADHGGELVIESSPGYGCRVDIIFPVKGQNS
jgi:two-component system nitrogen regulation sensor histidine kinase GlnL